MTSTVKFERIWKTDRERVLAAAPGGFVKGDKLLDGLTGADDVCSRCGLKTIAESEPPPAVLYVGPFELGGRVKKLVYCGRCRSSPAPIELEASPLRPAADLADGRTDDVDHSEREEDPKGRGAPAPINDGERDPDREKDDRENVDNGH